MRRPNIVVVLADDMGAGDLGAAGNRWADTPTLDGLADDGVTLTTHYSGSCMCAPARAALLTGRYPRRSGAVDVVRGLDRIAWPGSGTATSLSRGAMPHCATVNGSCTSLPSRRGGEGPPR